VQLLKDRLNVSLARVVATRSLYHNIKESVIDRSSFEINFTAIAAERDPSKTGHTANGDSGTLG
jgi:hypothetical protein